MNPPRHTAVPFARNGSRFLRAAAVLVTAAVATLGSVSVADAADAAPAPYMTYLGTSVNSARVPAEQVDLSTVTGVQFDHGTYYVNGAERGTIDEVSASGSTYTGTGEIDLTGYNGSVTVVAKIYSGKYMVQSVTKYVRAVPVDTTSIPTGFPTAATTGVPAGTKLTPSTKLDIWTAGTVLDGLDIQGCLVVHVPNVTVRNSRITCTTDTLRAVSLIDAPGFVMEDSEIASDGSAGVAVGWSGYTLRRVNIHGTQDGPRLGDNVTITDSYVHDMARTANVHSDAMQSTSGSNIVVQHNTLDPRVPGVDDFLNSAVQLGTETGAQRLQNAIFQGNFFNGGSYSVNLSCDANVSAVTFKGNRYGHGNRYGAVTAPAGMAGVTFTDERWADTQSLVKVAPAAC